MNYNQAATLLGVQPGTPEREARKEYLSRAHILHSDRYAGGAEADVKAAESAMAQLNEAWEVYQRGPTPSYASHGTYQSPPEPDPEFPQ